MCSSFPTTDNIPAAILDEINDVLVTKRNAGRHIRNLFKGNDISFGRIMHYLRHLRLENEDMFITTPDQKETIRRNNDACKKAFREVGSEVSRISYLCRTERLSYTWPHVTQVIQKFGLPVSARDVFVHVIQLKLLFEKAAQYTDRLERIVTPVQFISIPSNVMMDLVGAMEKAAFKHAMDEIIG